MIDMLINIQKTSEAYLDLSKVFINCIKLQSVHNPHYFWNVVFYSNPHLSKPYKSTTSCLLHFMRPYLSRSASNMRGFVA